MKTFQTVMMIMALLVAATGLVTADETHWMDMANCAMCKSIMDQPGLMESMSMEVYDLSDGMVQVCTVKPGQMEAYKTAMAGMDATAKKLQAGEELPLCNMCQAFMGLMAAGAQMEVVPTKSGSLEMMRSASPEGVTQIHEWAERTRSEMAKMMESKKADAGK
jgi:hypothetical protein